MEEDYNSRLNKMQKEEYLIKNACYSVTKYYLCKQNNKRSLLGRKQRNQVTRSFLNRYQFSSTNKVTSLFSTSCILRIILQTKRALIERQFTPLRISVLRFSLQYLASSIHIFTDIYEKLQKLNYTQTYILKYSTDYFWILDRLNHSNSYY